MVKRMMAVAAAALMSLTGPAFAQDAPSAYPPAPSPLVVDQPTAPAGGTITLTATGFAPGSTVTFTLSSGVVLGTAVADANGTAVLVATLPPGLAAGTHTVTASGVDANGNPRTQTVTITVSQMAAPAKARRAQPRYAG